MIAVHSLVASNIPKPLRPFDVSRDLIMVADLVQQCFTGTLDQEGQDYVKQMRSAARNPVYLRWASAAGERDGMPNTGYVWEEGGKIVGNLTLIPFTIRTKRYYLIANVAVHPDWRRRGIARALTDAALEHTKQRRDHSTWLHVRQENKGAVNLYRSAGFVERARRATWQRPVKENQFEFPSAIELQWSNLPATQITAPRRDDWPVQQAWLQRLYPPEVTWQLSLNPNAFRSGIWGIFYRFFVDTYIRQWSIRLDGSLIGVLAWQATNNYTDRLWLSTSPQFEDLAAYQLLRQACGKVSPKRPLTLDYPAEQATKAIQSAGFDLSQTLIWMSLPPNS